MSDEALLKAEKKRLKAAKKAAKAAKAEAAASNGDSTGASTPLETNVSNGELKKKDKKAKKFKTDSDAAVSSIADAGPSAPTSGGEGEDSTNLTKEEKKRLKAEKRARKEAKRAKKRALEAEGDGETNGVEKKAKLDQDVGSSKSAATATNGDLANGSSKKSKKSKIEGKVAAGGQAASSPVSTSASAPQPSSSFSAEQSAYLEKNNITLLPRAFPPHTSIPTLPISQPLLNHLKQFRDPTSIQACTWPPLLAGKDVIGIAETGSGKTLSFGIPALQHLSTSSDSGTGIGVLVLAPTRELAQQSHETFVAAGKGVKISSVCVFGGVGKGDQLRELKKKDVRVVVGTPGRTLDLADSGDLDLSGVSYLVLDEADRMLDQGFENDIRRIIAHCPSHNDGRQTVMFSATWPESVRRLASTFLRDPIRVTVGSDELSANKRIEQIVEVLDDVRQKDGRMLYHLKSHLQAHPSSASSPTRILVFALYKKEAQRLEYTIGRAGYSIAGLHGDLSQDARFKALDKFKTGQVNVLVATDVAARGLDIPDVGLVLNVTFPLTTEDFVHRCGRTGRAGKSGKAVTFFTGEGHEKALAGEFMRVLRDAGAKVPKEMDRFPTTIKKKEHGSYGAFYKDISDAPAPTKIKFD